MNTITPGLRSCLRPWVRLASALVTCVALATPALASAAQSASIFKEQKFSDHAPLTIDYDFTL